MWREKKRKKKTGIRADTMSPHVGHGWTQTKFFQVSRDTTGNIFFLLPALPDGRLIPKAGSYIHTSHIHTHTYRVLVHTHKQLSPSLASKHLAWQAFFPCVHGPFSLGAGIISLPWFQNTIISGKSVHTHVAKYARPPDLTFFFFFFFFLNFLLTGGNGTHYTVPKVA